MSYGEGYGEGHHHHHHHHGGGDGYMQQGGGYQGGPGGYPGGPGGYPGGPGGYPGGPGGYPGGPGGYPGGGYGQGYCRREFFIVSEMNNRVLDIEHGHAGAETPLCAYDRKHPPAKNQLWYLDQQGFIKSALNEMTFHNHANGHHLKTTMNAGDPRSQWMLEGQRIANRVGECMDIKGASNHNGAEVISYKYEGHKNQHWRFEYV